MKKKSFQISLAVALIATISFLTVNCETGLGPSVDVQKPSVAITYPPATAAVRDAFVLAGSCDDDQGVTAIFVTVYDSGNNPVPGFINIPATVLLGGKTWCVRLNEGVDNPDKNPPFIPEKNYPLKDGTYTFQVQAMDKAGRQSDVVACTFDIDNTAPILILNKPMAMGTSKPTSYGRIFKLAGDTNDDHSIKVSFYFKECVKPSYETGGAVSFKDNAPIAMVEDMPVMSMSSDAPLILARYYDNPGDDEDAKTFTENYERIYRGVSPNGNIDKFYYGGIRLMDTAKVYQNPNENVAENNSRGNETWSYFLNTDDLSKTLNSIGTDGIKAGDIKKLANGTSTFGADVKNTVREALFRQGNFVSCSSASDVGENSSVFSLNPDNNPTWSIANYTIKPGDQTYAKDGLGFRDYNLGASHTLTITPNTDGDYVVPKNIALYCVQVVQNASGGWDQKGDRIYLLNAGEWTDESSNEAVSLGGLSLEKLGSGEYYKFYLEGVDREGTDYIEADSRGYGLKVASSETAPTLLIDEDTKPCSNKEYFKLSKLKTGIKITGTVVEANKKLGYIDPNDSTKNKAPIRLYVWSVTGPSGADLSALTKEEVSKKLRLWKTDNGEEEVDLTDPTTWEKESMNWRWELTIQDNDADDTTKYPEGNYTFTFQMAATNRLGEENDGNNGDKAKGRSLEPRNADVYIGDNAAPIIKFKNNDLVVKDASGNITGNKTNPIVLGGVSKDLTVPESETETVTTYKLSGAWIDANGSGTNILYYYYGDTVPPKNGAGWIEAEDYTEGKNRTTNGVTLNITVDGIEEGTGKVFAAWSKDAVGNESDIVSIPNITFDFRAPTTTMTCGSTNILNDTLSLGKPEGSTSLEIKGTVNDTYLLDPTDAVTVVAKKDGAVTTTGVTFSKDSITNRTGGGQKCDWTVTLETTADIEGKWTFEATVKDKAGHTKKSTSKVLEIDTKPPVFDDTYASKIDKAVLGADQWINCESMPKLDVKYIESGVKAEIEYIVGSSTDFDSNTSPKKGPYSLKNNPVTPEIWKSDISDISVELEQGENQLHLRAIDAAGNKSTVKTFTVKYDNVRPTLKTVGDTSVKTKGDATINVKVEANDATSGIDEVKFNFNGAEAKTADGFAIAKPADAKGNGEYTLTIPVAKLTEGTHTVTATATDKAKNATASAITLCTIIVDKTAPSLEVTNVTASDKKTIGGTSYYLFTEDSLSSITGDKDSLKNGKYEKYNFTLRGTWGDKSADGNSNGTGTKTLSYSGDGGTSWTALAAGEAPVNATDDVSWSKKFSINYNDQDVYKYYFKATDQVGNEAASDATKFTKLDNVIFDFSDPTITVSVPKELTNLKKTDGTAEPLVITVTAHDDRKLNATPIALDIKKGTTSMSAGANLVISEGTATNNGRDVTWTVTISDPGANGFDGNWSITATAKDEVERTTPVTKTFTIDTKAPEIENGDSLILPGQNNAKLNDTSKWYKTYSFTIQGYCSDNVSGVDTIYYWVHTEKTTETFNQATTTPKGSIELKNIVAKDTFKIPTEGFEAGTNTIYFWAKDAAGNVSTAFSHTLKVDDVVPSAEIDTTPTATYNYRTLTNDTEKLVFKGTVSDNASGVTKLTLTLGTVELSVTNPVDATAVANGTSTPANKGKITLGTQRSETIDGNVYFVRDWTAEFEPGIFGSATTGSKPLNYSVEDAAGMKNTSTFVTIKLDKAKPKSKITQPADGAQGVNKVFKVAGSTEDGSDNVRSVELKYKVGTETTWHSFAGGLKKDGSGNLVKEGEYYVWDKNGTGGIKLDATGPSLDWKVKIDSVEAFGGTNAAQGKDVTLSVEALDEAGNKAQAGTTESKSVKFNVDQNADRPIIKLTQEVKKVGTTSYISQKTLSGTIDDDDGLTNSDDSTKKLKLWVSKSPITSKPASGEVALSGSDWTFDLGSSEVDGAKTIYFYVEDSEGGEFTYSYSGADNYGNPYFTYTENGVEQTKTNLTSAFAYTQDTEAPLVTKVEWFAPSATSATETFPLVSNTSAIAPWLGGTTKNTGSLKITATDTNGISAIRIKVTGGGVTKGFTTGTTETISGTEYKKVGTLASGVWTIPLNDTTFDFAHWSTAEYTVSVTATDNSGQSANNAKNGAADVAADYKFKLDFTPPDVNMIVSPSATIITSATITTTFSDVVDGFEGVGLEGVIHYWAISKTEPTTNWTEVGNITTLIAKLAWEDVSRYSNSDYATKNSTTGLLEVPIWFKVVDKLGNTKTVKEMLTIDGESSYAEAEINSPEDGSKVGSTTKLSGIASIGDNKGTGAIGNASIREVRIQIDADGDGDYDGDDYKILSGTAALTQFVGTGATQEKNQKSANSKWKLWSETKAKFKNTEEYQTGESTPKRLQGNATDWYILADVNDNNWGLTVPTNLFGLSCKVTGENRPHVKYRVKALGQMNKNKAGTDGLFVMEDYNASGTSTGNKHIRGWTAGGSLSVGVDEREIVIDSQAPQIKDIYLVQYVDNDPTKAVAKSRAYKDNMYIGPGDWYITANLEDETALDSYTLSEISNNTNFTFTDVSEEDLSISGDLKKKAIIPTQITGSSTTSGKIELELGVVDNSAKTGQKNITINIDKDAPTIPTDANGLILYDDTNKQLSEDIVIENNDGTFKLGNTYGDSTKNLQDVGGSNISYVAFWFERQPKAGNSTGKRVFNPMLDSIKSGTTYSNQTTLTDSETANAVFINEDGLAVMHITGLTRSSDTTITLPSLNANITKNIRYGGLVQIGGSYVLINKVDGNVLTLSEAADVKFTDAYFVFAQIVNDPSNGADKYGEVGATDGDGMQETLLNKDYGGGKSGWQWYGNINSANIPDGPIIVHVTAIDGAGNVSKAQVKTKIANNRPRITRVMVASDWNNNGKYDVRSGVNLKDEPITVDDIKNNMISSEATKSGTEFGEFVYYSTIDKNNSKVDKIIGLSNATLESYFGTIFMVPNKLCIIPQFTGGNNGSIKYTWEVISPTAAADTTSKKLVEFGEYSKVTTSSTPNALVDVKSSITGDTNNKLTSNETDSAFIDNNLQYKGGIELSVAQLTPHDDGTKPIKCLAFTFWDATDETTQGVDSLNALLKVPVILNVNDKTMPRPTIKPFYWKNKTDNSVYQEGNGGIKGHIELEADWKLAPGYTDTGLDSKLRDDDPKVSGQIIVRGSVYDDIQLKDISIHMEGLNSYGVAKVLSYDTDTQTWKTESAVNPDPNSGNKIMAASAKNITADQTGHLVEYEIVLNTGSITNTADYDKAIRIYATDWNNNFFDANSAYYEYDATAKEYRYYGSTTSGYVAAKLTTQTTEDANTAYYKVDVVPYVTNIVTSLSTLDESYPTAHTRSALGRYTVGEGETLTLEGYNIKDKSKPSIVYVGSDSSSLGNDKTFTIGALKSGKVRFTVNNVNALNNYNYNDAKGDYAKTVSAKVGDKDIYDNYYNRQPNGYNNNRLTDDLELAVWQFNSEAVKPKSGMALQPIMKIDPKYGVIGFAYIDGPLWFSMPYGRGGATNSTSHDRWVGSYDFFTSVGMTYDDDGYSWGVAAGGDINDNAADTYSLASSRWGTSDTGKTGIYNGNNLVRLDRIGVNNNDSKTWLKQRFKSSTLTTAKHGDQINVYLAYYDGLTDEVRFKAGKYTKGRTSAQFSSDNNTYFKDNKGNVPAATIYNETQAIAKGKTGARGAGQYVCLAVVPGSSADNDAVVAVWWDAGARKMRYAYNTSPLTVNGRAGDTTGNGWTTVDVFNGRQARAGEYCQIAVDSKKGIHIAAYDSQNLDVVYAYASSYSGPFSTCTVDSSGVVGEKLTLDVALDATGGNAIPYIGYYATSSVRPKYAYKVLKTEAAPSGAESDKVTGDWESMVVPTASSINHEANGQHNKINIGVWKNSGVLDNSKTTTSTDKYNGAPGNYEGDNAWGFVWGNGTKNAVLGYAIEVGTDGYLETAQMK